MRALVIGATGAVGKDLVQQLIEDSSVERVDIFVRRKVVEIIESQDILKA